jgi:transcriptional regulator with XRE-family HTH domain
MGTFGDQLKQAREAQGVSLKAVAAETRIAVRHLAALEQSDLESLPRGPFAKGFIRAYAGFLRIDPEPILEACRDLERQQGLGPSESQRRTYEELSRFLGPRSEERSRLFLSTWRAGAVVALVGILGAVGWFVVGRDAPEPVSTSPRPVEPSASATKAPPEVAPRETPAAEEPSEAPATTVDPPTDGFHVSHSGVGTGVEDRRLVGRADRFVEGTAVFFWTRVLGGEPGQVVRHFWIHEGREVEWAELAIGGSHWRTQSRLVLPEGSTGRWAAEARTTDGQVLARADFLSISEDQ